MIRLVRLFVVTSIILFAIGPALGQEPVVYAHFIDVGQGDATLLEFPRECLQRVTGESVPERVLSVLKQLEETT